MRIVINEEICCARSLIRYYEIVLKSPYQDGDNWDGFRDGIVSVGEWLEDDILEIYHEGFPHLDEEELLFYAMTLKEAELAYKNDEKFSFILKYSDKCFKRIDRETLENYEVLHEKWHELYMEKAGPVMLQQEIEKLQDKLDAAKQNSVVYILLVIGFYVILFLIINKL